MSKMFMHGHHSVKFSAAASADDNNDDGDDESVGGDDVNHVLRHAYMVILCRPHKRVLYKNWD